MKPFKLTTGKKPLGGKKVVMKSKFEKEKEKKEEKKKQEQEAAAQVYAEFVKSFQEGADEAQGTFVRGGTYQPGTAEVAPTSEGPATYRMSAPAIHRRSGKTEMERLMDEIQGGKDKTENPREQQQPAPAGKRTKNMDAMLEEMKARRARGEAPPPVAPPKGAVPSYLDFDASATTNLHVGNLAPTVTEEQLQRRFEKYGPLLSLKVMWPRSTDERTRKKNSGFVAFIHRADADRARLALDGIELDGLPIRIGWAKAISKHSANVFPPQKHVSAAVRDAKSSEQLPVAELDRQHSGFRELEEYLTSSQSKDLAGEERTDKEGRGGKVQIPRGAAIVDVEVPRDASVRKTIDLLAEYVHRDGQQFENAILARERANQDTKFWFLWDFNSLEGTYYRWKVYSLLMGDSLKKWREAPFQMFAGGPWWRPPSCSTRAKNQDRSRRADRRSLSRSRSRGRYHRDRRSSRSRSRSRSPSPFMDRRRNREGTTRRGRGFSSRGRSPSPGYSSDNYSVESSSGGYSDDERNEHRTRLSNREFHHWCDILRHLTMERPKIKDAMAFALDRAECSGQLCQILRDSLLVDETPAPVKVARMYLLSDILHNSSAQVRNASSFRTLLLDALPQIFVSLNHCLRNVEGRITAETMKEKIARILSWWEHVSLFPPMFIAGLEATFYFDSDNEEEEVEQADLEDLKRQCKQAAQVTTGTKKDILTRLRWVQAHAKQKVSGMDSGLASMRAGAAVSSFTDIVLSGKTELPEHRPEAAGYDNKPIARPSGKGRSSGKREGGEGVGEEEEEVGDSAENEEAGEGGDVDGEGVEGEELDEDVDGEPLEESIDGEPLEDPDLDGEPLEEEDVDGEPLGEEDLDGEPLDDVDGEPFNDIDGEPLEEGGQEGEA